MNLRVIPLTLFAVLSGPVTLVPLAQAQNICAPVLALPGVIQTPDYDPFAQSPLIDVREIDVRDANCPAPVVVETALGWGNSQPRLVHDGNELHFKMTLGEQNPTANVGVIGGVILSENITTINLLPSGSGNAQNYARLVIPEGQIVPPGYYTLSLAGIAQSGSGLLTQTQGTTDVRATPIAIATNVLSVLKLGVTGCDLSSSSANLEAGNGGDLASACTLSLGDPTTGMVNGDSRRARLNAMANVNFKIAMTSANGGSLKLAGIGANTRDTQQVDYSASLEGQGQSSAFTCSGSNCGSSDLIAPSSSPLGTDLYFQVRVNESDMTQKRAGRYTDTITLIIQPAS